MEHRSRMKLVILSMATILLSPLIYADNIVVYRWVDKNNVVHFSQHQPEHANYTELSLAAIPKTPDVPKVTNEPDIEPQPKTSSTTEVKSETLDKCAEAKENVHTLQSYDNIQYTNESGELKVLSDIEKKQQLAINKKQVEVYCELP